MPQDLNGKGFVLIVFAVFVLMFIFSVLNLETQTIAGTITQISYYDTHHATIRLSDGTTINAYNPPTNLKEGHSYRLEYATTPFKAANVRIIAEIPSIGSSTSSKERE